MSDAPKLAPRRGVKAGLKTQMAVMPDEPDYEADYKQMMAELREQARTDLGAKKLWLEIYEANKPAADGSFTLNITPYDIEDKKLSQIVQQAEPGIVSDVLDGLRVRLEVDEAPGEIKKALQCFRAMFEHWAADAYAPDEE